MILKLTKSETDVVITGLIMAGAHYRTRMAESENGARVYYDKLIETIKRLKLRIEQKRND